MDYDFLTVFGFTRLIVCLIGIVLGLELHDKSRMSRQFIWIINDNPNPTPNPKDDQDQDEDENEDDGEMERFYDELSSGR